MAFTGTIANINAGIERTCVYADGRFHRCGIAADHYERSRQHRQRWGIIRHRHGEHHSQQLVARFSSAQSTYNVNENGGPATITITRTGGSAGTATVLFETSNGTAGAGDYTTVSQTVTFVDGDTSETVNIPITNDTDNEADETVNLTLSNAGGSGTLGTPNTAVLTITNDDAVAIQLQPGCLRGG